MKLEQAITQVSKELNLPYDVCYRAYMAMWKFILTKTQELPLSEDMPVEEFSKLRPNFNLPSLGKLFITTDNFEKKNRRIKIIKSFKEKKNAKSSGD